MDGAPERDLTPEAAARFLEGVLAGEAWTESEDVAECMQEVARWCLWEIRDGAVSGSYLQERFGIPQELAKRFVANFVVQ